jgi:hypothetical protein
MAKRFAAVVTTVLLALTLTPLANAGTRPTGWNARQCIVENQNLVWPGPRSDKPRILYPFRTQMELILWCYNPGPLPR